MREARLRWFGHMHRREVEYVWSRVSRIEPLGRRRKERPKRRLMAVVMEDMQVVGVDAEDRAKWRRMIRCADP